MKKTIGMGGFTLAEVLITLGIIGVVAAMTMPTLINSTQGAQYKTAFKKSLSVLSQAVVMNIALNDYDLSQVVAGNNEIEANDGGTPDDTSDDIAAAAAGGPQSLYDLFSNRLNVVRTANGKDFTTTAGQSDAYTIISLGSQNDQTDKTTFRTNHCKTGCANNYPSLEGTAPLAKFGANATMLFMNDGITFIFDNTQTTCQEADTGIGVSDSYCFGYIDVNGQKAPNRIVQCDGGTITGTAGGDDATCTVTNPTDIYPIALYNQSVVPASAAARAVLYNK